MVEYGCFSDASLHIGNQLWVENRQCVGNSAVPSKAMVAVPLR